ncbi:S8 family serine peptidase [Candidatus Obscuribacterales bacterium]|nr:S8 family serine peptidase [Candidatus Obscuribacterales bacterium]
MAKLTAIPVATSLAIAILMYAFNGADASTSRQKDFSPTKEQMAKVAAASRTRSLGDSVKLDAGLQVLASMMLPTRGDVPRAVMQAQEALMQAYGIQKIDKDTCVEVRITGGADATALKKLGANVHFVQGNVTYASVPLRVLSKVASLDGVQLVKGIHVPHTPPTPPALESKKLDTAPPTSRGGLSDTFDRQGMTGKGVVVGVVDSGIDWRHPDFLSNGKSRILYLWDMTDDTYELSGGKIGSKAPNTKIDGTSLGTVYSNEQINAALKGNYAVSSWDDVGHGTACAGTAAGNGRATANGVPAGTYTGVAPEADLIVVDAAHGTEGGIRGDAHLGVRWIVEKSKELNKPCSINLSWGGQYGSHSGMDAQELFLNDLTGKGVPGVAICVAGGNERSDSFHASSRIGPDREGANKFSSEIELNVYKPGTVEICFDTQDDWGVTVIGDAETYEGEKVKRFLVDEAGNPIGLNIWNNGTAAPNCLAVVNNQEYPGTLFPGENFSTLDYVQRMGYSTEDGLLLWLPRGKYYLSAWGASENVKNGRFDVYAWGSATFGKGSEHQFMVGTPGNAANVITVGAYDFRSSWPNIEGTNTFFNIEEGGLASYSNPGYSRSGAVKPDIVAPATYAISPIARDADSNLVMMGGSPRTMVTKDGYHIAWRGTSAATPFAAGTIALMLQKNPTLDAEQIRKILADSATKDEQTGGTPNRDWGYGKINPAKAVTLTPSK